MTAVNYDSELRRAGAHATHGWRRLRLPRAALCARHLRPDHHAAVRDGRRCSADLIAALRPVHGEFRAPPRASELGALARHRIPRAATSGARSSTARGFRSPSASGPPRSAPPSASSSGSPPVIVGGRVDLVIQRVPDILQALPLAGAGAGDVGRARARPSPTWSSPSPCPSSRRVSRVVRSNALALRELPFVESAGRSA